MDLPLVAQSLDFTCGAACFESLMRFFNKSPKGELYYAEKLGTFNLGYTAPEKIVELAQECGLQATLKNSATLKDLEDAFAKEEVLFVTWWDEDAGHYSLIRSLDSQIIELMDPWLARDGLFNQLELRFFIPLWEQRGARLISVSPISSLDILKT